MTDRLTPGQLRDLAEAVQSFDTLLAASLRKEAARREAEGQKVCRYGNDCPDSGGPCPACDGKGYQDYGDPELGSRIDDCDHCHGTGKADAPPPPAPDDLLIRSLRELIVRHGLDHGVGKCAKDAIDAIKDLCARAEAAEARVKQLEAFMSKEVVPQLRAALAQGGNDRLRDDDATARTADQMPGLTKLLGGDQ